ncbi:acyl-CoA dehydrogenase family protein [Niveispirillum sp. BGYR6]|uniref:acyl-CoA dehydrogenase family protein n=1 Tax=Niveispirillum sp. BGYR6 TaxID=2971249 RepID=UPI0022B991C0|nr:acyl-CoA dehydrogenase family protein [Niveispirillum sp. BGYR6]MDG5497508.1 oxidoreductase [Niveispirillum sp. BGYR6]
MDTATFQPNAAHPAVIAPPEPSLTPDEMLRRAVALRPRLRAAQEECQRLGRVSQEINDALDAAGFYRIVQPRRFGGYEFDIPTFYRVMIEISRGCTETGWVLALVSGNPLMLAKFPDQAQFHAYGTTGEFRSAGSFAPPGTAIPVEGGYRVSGKWQNGSGCDISTHFIPLVLVQGPGGPSPAQVLLDRDQYTIVDDWNVIGMRGTGSKRVVAEDVFIPSYRLMPCAGMNRGAEPLNMHCATCDNPVYSTLVSPFLISQPAAVAVGTAWAALDHYEEILWTKKSAYPPYQEKYHDPIAQRNYGTALRLVATAEAALIGAGHDFMQYAYEAKEKGIPFDDERELRLRSVSLQCAQLAWEAFELVFHAGGTSTATREGHPLERMLRNFGVLKTHAVLQLEPLALTTGKVKFGMAR